MFMLFLLGGGRNRQAALRSRLKKIELIGRSKLMLDPHHSHQKRQCTDRYNVLEGGASSSIWQSASQIEESLHKVRKQCLEKVRSYTCFPLMKILETR